jgi:UDP:flavonoid glycosyltransferase YjiC (YdhE family)
MRVLITTPSGLGHVLPMVPLARAIQARGHEVVWATAADTRSWVEDAGVPTVAAGIVQADQMLEFWRRNPEVRALPPEQMPNVMFPKLFGGVAAPVMLADLLPIVRDWEPDLVVHDAAELAGPIVAALVGVPSVVKAFGALIPRERVAAAGDEVAPLWRSVGREPRPFGGLYDHLYLDVYPPGLQPAVADHVGPRQLLRPVAYDVAEDSRREVELPDAGTDRPLVYLTMGTVFNDPTALRRVVDAVAALDVRLLVTVGPNGDPEALGDQPPHVRVERYVPQTLVLDRCGVIVSHAGSGTVLATLSLGLPQLCLPQGADQFGNAAAVAGAGAGVALLPVEASGEAIADALGRLLAERSFRDAATRVSETIASMPGPDDVAEVLERLP